MSDSLVERTAALSLSSGSAAAAPPPSRYALDAAPLVETDPQADPLAPPASDGGFRPLRSLDVLPIDRLLPTIARRVRLEPLTVVQAATGSGKSSRIPATLVREWYAEQNVREREEQRKEYAASLKAKFGGSELSEASYPPSLRRHPLIIVTQPRRIAAISLAKRVAQEMGEEVGQTVGFKIGHESMSDFKTRLVFVTSGWLLQKLVHNPGYLAECSHLVLDEIHERGLDADILYVILKRILRALIAFDKSEGRPHTTPSYPSMVLMSATFNTDLFGAYFCELWKHIPAFRHYAQARNLQAIQIETRRYPTQIYHLEAIMQCPILANNMGMINRLLPDNPSGTIHALVGKMSKPPPPGGGSAGVALGPISNSLLHLISWLCSALALCHRSDPEEGCCILVFFPGLNEIEAAAQIIDESLLRATYQRTVRITGRDEQTGQPIEEEVFDDEEEEHGGWRRGGGGGGGGRNLASDCEVRSASMSSLVELMILHSVVEDQLKVFEPVAAGQTRIILATNIAESSVTIPYVKYVLDLGAHKEVEYNHRFQCEMLSKKWISQASAKQRAGRCGRLSPGTVFRLYPSAVFNNPDMMPPYDLPELLRVSLASTILRLKMTADSSEEGEARAEKKAAAAANKNVVAIGVPKFDPSVCNLNDPHSVLSECMQPPDLDSIDQAYEELLKAGAVQLTGEGAQAHKELSRFQTSVPGAAASSSSKNARVVRRDDDGFESGMTNDEKRAVYQASAMTPLGRFFAALPFSFHLSRLVALGVVFGPRYLVHAVVISSALSMADVYLMPMQSRGAQGGGGGGGGDRRDRGGDDPFPQYVAKTTRMRMWCDAGIGSDAIAIVRLMDAYLKYRAHIAQQGATGVGGLGRKSYLLDQWCSDRGVHMKRIKTLASSIAEIALRLSSLVHQEEEREALLQLAALCGKTKARAPPQRNSTYGARGGASASASASAPNSRFPQSSSSASASAPGAPRKHYTYANSRAAVADRDSDRGNSEHDDLFHLLSAAQAGKPGAAHSAYDFHSDILSTSTVPEDLLSLDAESVCVLQFMLTSALLPNLLMGSATAVDLGKGLPYGPRDVRSMHDEPAYLRPDNTVTIEKIPVQLLSGSQEIKLQHRPEFAEVNPAFTHVLIANSTAGGGKKGGKKEPPVPMGSMALEFADSSPDSYTRLRVALDGRPHAHLKEGSPVPLLAMPTLEMLILHRMFNNSRLNIMDRGSSGGAAAMSNQFQSQAYQQQHQQQHQGPSIHQLADPKLPGKAIKWRLFSPRSPARLDFLSPIAALASYQLPARALKGMQDGGAFSDFDPASGVDPDAPSIAPAKPDRAAAAAAAAAIAAAVAAQSGRGGKKGKKGGKGGGNDKKKSKADLRAEQMAAMKAAASNQSSSKATNEFQVWSVAASMTVSSGVAAEIRAEKVTLLPVGVNAGVTSAILSLLLPGELIVSADGRVLTGVRFEGVSLHFSVVLDAALQPALLRMREMSKNKSFPSTDPAGFVRRPKLNLLPPSQQRGATSADNGGGAPGASAGANANANASAAATGSDGVNWRGSSTSAVARQAVAANPAAAKTISDAAQAYEAQRALVLERKRAREAAAAGVAARPASAAPAPAAAAAAPAVPATARPSTAAAPPQSAAAAAAAATPAPMRTKQPKEKKPAKADKKQQQQQVDSDFVPENWDDPSPTQSTARGAKGKKEQQQKVAAPANNNGGASASAPAASSRDPAALLSALTSVFNASPSASLNMNALCVAFAARHRATWKELAGTKLSMKDFIARNSNTFDVHTDANNQTTITYKQHKQAAGK